MRAEAERDGQSWERGCRDNRLMVQPGSEAGETH